MGLSTLFELMSLLQQKRWIRRRNAHQVNQRMPKNRLSKGRRALAVSPRVACGGMCRESWRAAIDSNGEAVKEQDERVSVVAPVIGRTTRIDI